MILHFLRLLLFFYICGIASGCKYAAYFAGAAELQECKENPSLNFNSQSFQSSFEKLGFEVSKENAHFQEFKSPRGKEYRVKIVAQIQNTYLIQIIGLDVLPQGCVYNRDCPLSDKGRAEVLDVMSKIGNILQCKLGRTSFTDIKKVEEAGVKLDKWNNESFYLFE